MNVTWPTGAGTGVRKVGDGITNDDDISLERSTK